jgi:2-phospho-L-lactate guanylyltransferase
MSDGFPIVAVVPVKETAQAKQRLAGLLSAAQRRELALAMLQDVLKSLARVRELAGIVVVTLDPGATKIARRHGAEIVTEGARDGHTAAVTAAAGRLARRGHAMLALPGDIPLVTPADIRAILAAQRLAPAFTIVPAHDHRGSNAVLVAPADAVALRFGDNSFYPHLAAAAARGIAPRVLHRPAIALDVDTPEDLARFAAMPSRTRSHALLAGWQAGRPVERTEAMP